MNSLKFTDYEEDVILFNNEESDFICQIPGGLKFELGILKLESGVNELKNCIARELKQNSNWFLNYNFGMDWINTRTNDGILDRSNADVSRIREEINRIISKYSEVEKIELLEIFLNRDSSLMIGLRLKVNSEMLDLGVILN